MQNPESLADRSLQATDVVPSDVSWQLATETLADLVTHLTLFAEELERFLEQARNHLPDEIEL